MLGKGLRLPMDAASGVLVPSKLMSQSALKEIGLLHLITLAATTLVVVWCTFFNLVDSRASPLGFAIWSMCALGWGMFYSMLYQRLNAEYRTTLLNCTFMLVATLATCIASNVAYAMHTPGPLLKDAGFALIPRAGRTSVFAHISEVMVFATFGPMVAYGVLTRHLKLLNAWCRCTGMMYLLRACVCWNTSMPGPAEHCSYDSPHYTPPLRLAVVLSRVSQIWGATKTCGDLLYSGHTGWILISCLLMVYYAPRKRPALRRFIVLANVVCFVLFLVGVVASRRHYTADVVLSIIISAFIVDRFKDGWAARTAYLRDGPAATVVPQRKDSSDIAPLVVAPPGPATWRGNEW